MRPARLPWYANECVHAYVTDLLSSLTNTSCLRSYAFLMIPGYFWTDRGDDEERKGKKTIRSRGIGRCDPAWEKGLVFEWVTTFFRDPLSRSEFASGGKNGGRREIFFPPIIREGERRSRVRNFRVITRRLFPFVADNKKTLASTRFLENSVEKNACPFSIVNRWVVTTAVSLFLNFVTLYFALVISKL